VTLRGKAFPGIGACDTPQVMGWYRAKRMCVFESSDGDPGTLAQIDFAASRASPEDEITC